MMKRILFGSLVVGLVMVSPACNWWPFKKKEAHETSASSQLHVLNVLDKEQYDECHIPGSVNVPFEKVAEFAQGLDKNAEIYVHCSNYQCASSQQVVKQLKELGFEHVASYEGGIAAWYQEGLPVDGAVAQGAPASEYLTKVVEQVAELPAEVAVVTTQALRDRLVNAGLLRLEQDAPTAAPVA